VGGSAISLPALLGPVFWSLRGAQLRRELRSGWREIAGAVMGPLGPGFCLEGASQNSRCCGISVSKSQVTSFRGRGWAPCWVRRKPGEMPGFQKIRVFGSPLNPFPLAPVTATFVLPKLVLLRGWRSSAVFVDNDLGIWRIRKPLFHVPANVAWASDFSRGRIWTRREGYSGLPRLPLLPLLISCLPPVLRPT